MLDAETIRKLQQGDEYMPGRPMHAQTEEERFEAISMEAAAAERRKAKPPAKGSAEARERMAKVRAAKGKKAEPDDGKKQEPVGLLAKEDGETK